MQLLSLGLANKEIAERLAHSHNTTRAHLRKIFKKLNAATRTEAIRIAAELSLMDRRAS